MTELTRVSGGVRNDILDIATADQLTILGDGTTEDPLRAGRSIGRFEATLSPVHGPAQLGAPVFLIGPGRTVALGSAGVAAPPTSPLAQVVGLISQIASPTRVTVQYAGILSLPSSAWLAVTGAPTLALGQTYYATAAFGHLDVNPPVASGAFVVQVGASLDSTTLILSLPAFPTQNP